VSTPVSVPVNACGVSAAVGGFANSGRQGGSASNTIVADGGNAGSNNGNAGFAAVGSGNTANAPISAPVDVCGIATAVAASPTRTAWAARSAVTFVG
jgi:hypothetical protein